MNQAINMIETEHRPIVKYARSVSRSVPNSLKFPLFLILLHLPLGLLLYNAGWAAVIHPAAVLFIGMRRALLVEEKLARVALIPAYIVGAEILWRMANVPIFWEFGKYAAGLIMITALIRRRFWKMPAFPVFYFVLLLPAALIVFIENRLNVVQNLVSFNLSGPFLLAVSCWFFSHLQMSRSEARKLFLALIIPLISVAVVTLFYTVTAPEIEFTGESNFATSGGFGPNQVSSMLGLGAFLCFASFLLFKNSFDYSIFFGAAALLFSAQSVLTFSRGGIYNAVGAILLIIVFQLRSLSQSFRRLLPITILVGLFLVVIFPFLNNFTGGALLERFEDSETTGRFEIVEADMQVFLENPILGVGLGGADVARQKFLNSKEAISHTEFSRLLSEHGSLGVFALGTIALMIIFNFRKQKSSFGKAFVAGVFAWSSLFMLGAAMRLAAPSFILGMIYLTIINFQTRRAGRPVARRLAEK
jgi:O-antigen ligase